MNLNNVALSKLMSTSRAKFATKTLIDPRVRAFSFWPWKEEKPIVKYSIVKPGKKPPLDLSIIPPHIQRPDYTLDGHSKVIPRSPVIWNNEEIDKMRASCALARQTLEFASKMVEPGVPTEVIDRETRQFIVQNGAYPSPLGFQKFPRSISTSVNNVAAHGIPDSRKLEEGDIVNIDITVFLEGFHGDCSDTFPVGKIDPQAEKLIQIARECLEIGIAECRDHAYYMNIGKAINDHCKRNKFASIQNLLGHGIGTFFHGPPNIYHCLNSYPGRMKAGMIFTVEPCVSEGGRRIKYMEDNWTLSTVDMSRTAQSEHTILVTQSGAEILTMI